MVGSAGPVVLLNSLFLNVAHPAVPIVCPPVKITQLVYYTLLLKVADDFFSDKVFIFYILK